MVENIRPPVVPVQGQGAGLPLKPHRGVVVLVLGILGIVVCFICGIIAWVMGNNDLREMTAGIMDPSGRGMTQAGIADQKALPRQDRKESQEDFEARIKWWREARFGMFIHWGPVSLKGTEISWSRGGERRGISGKGDIPVEIYDNLYKEFNPIVFDARQWITIAKAAGMKYVVFTAKHCDGFALWHSNFTDYNISRSPFRRDICAELAEAAHEAGMRIGWYYSPMDWRDPDCRTERNARYVASMQGQLRELLGDYGRIDLLWFDTDGGPCPWDQRETYRLVRTLQPQIIINNRLDMGSNEDYNAQRIGPNVDYYTPEQRIGDFDNQRPWETCMTLGTQWSWKSNDTIKSLKECLHILIRCVGGDGNLLLNVGPMPTGQIEPRQVECLKQMGGWLQNYGESIYGTRGGPFKPGKYGASTRKGRTIYLHILNWPVEVLRLPPISAKVVTGTSLTGGKATVSQTDAGIEISVSAADRQEIDTIVALELDRPAIQLEPLAIIEPANAIRN